LKNEIEKRKALGGTNDAAIEEIKTMVKQANL